MNDLEIPDSARRIKDFFTERPSRRTVLDIKDWVRAGNQPHLWHGHTHTRPAAGSKVVYLDEFDLPEKVRRAKRWAVCPCCTPRHPKYGRDGKIAWFPDEGVVRLLGPKCFSNLNPEGHSEAVEELGKRRGREQDIQRLIKIRDEFLPLAASIRKALPLSAHVDRIGNEIAKAQKLQGVNLQNFFREGRLTIYGTETKIDRKTGELIKTPTAQVLHQIDGSELICNFRPFNDRPSKLKSRLNKFNDDQQIECFVERMSDQQVRTLLKNFTDLRKEAVDLLERLNRYLAFFNCANLANISHWASHPDSVFQQFFAVTSKKIRLGKQRQGCASIDISALSSVEKLNIPPPNTK